MINPTVNDIGRKVIYCARHSGAVPEEGVITSFNDKYVFARFGSDPHSKGSRPEDLEWAVRKVLGKITPSGFGMDQDGNYYKVVK